MIEKFLLFVEKTFTRADGYFISLVAIIFSLLRIPSVIEPYWYGDEGIYEVIGLALRSGRVLYSQIWDNKPPILYLIYALFSGDQFSVRLASLVVGVLSVIVFFMITKKFFEKPLAQYLSTSIFAILFGLPLIEGNIANAENFMVLPTLIALYILFCTKKNFIGFLFAGLLLSVSFLTKIVAIFDLAAFAVSVFTLRMFSEIRFDRDKIIAEIKEVILGIEDEVVLGISFLLPIALTSLYFLFNHAFNDFFRATFAQNVGYVAYGNYFIIPNGLLYLKLFFLFSSVMLAVRYRRTLERNGLVIFIWLFFSVFNALFSARPYTHYLLVALPSVCLAIGFILDNKKLMKVTIPVTLIAIALLLSTFKLNFRRIIPYYNNYIEYIGDHKSTEEYQSFFDRHTPRDYAIADFVKTKTEAGDNIFIWGDSAQIYALSGKLPPGRYTVAYHMTFYPGAIEETKKSFLKNSPKLIIQLKDDDKIVNFLEDYELKYNVEGTKIYEKQS